MGFDFEPMTAVIIEAALEVHAELGPGFVERVYHNAMKLALAGRGVPFDSEFDVAIFFQGAQVGLHRLDLFVSKEFVVELKAVEAIKDIHYAQTKSSIRAAKVKTGLLFNFNSVKLVIKRIVV